MASNIPTSGSRSFGAIVRLADPDHEREQAHQLEYEFGAAPNARKFYGDARIRGPYAGDSVLQIGNALVLAESGEYVVPR